MPNNELIIIPKIEKYDATQDDSKEIEKIEKCDFLQHEISKNVVERS